MKKLLLVAGILVVFIVAGIAFFNKPKTMTGNVVNEGQEKIGTALTGETKEFEITAKQWEFIPEVIEVNKGDLVKLKIKSTDVTHGFAIIEFGISETLKPGKNVEVEFIADNTGIFNFYCTVPCGPGHSDMRGMLVVK